MLTFKDYKHFIPIQIRFADVDRLKHVNNACYHNYIELGRVKYFNEVFGNKINWDISGFVLARTELDHLNQLYLTDDAYCFSKIIKIGNKSMQIKNSVIKQNSDGTLVECGNCLGVLVAMDYIKQKSITIPQEWRKCIENFEGKNSLNFS
ncbi:MAG: acyl-CoA thioesterase [Bacteroidetes bacterium]|nr:acyl-CoA thioesterase [Bacteroidota bacterium]